MAVLEQDVNRTFVQRMVEKILDLQIKWDEQKKNQFSHFFDLSASILTIRDRIELDEKITTMEQRYNLSLMALENIVFVVGNYSPHKRILIRVRTPKGLDGQWDLIHKKILNWHEIQSEFRRIRFWCLIKVQKRCAALGIDFSKVAELNKGVGTQMD